MRPSSRPAHFLLVEDDVAHADLVRMCLVDDEDPPSIDHVIDGVEAVAYLRREGEYADARRPDLIVLDLKLPRMGGHELLEYVKKDESLLSIPIVVLTTSANAADRARAYNSHANSYLTKPADFDEFQQLVRDLKQYWGVWNHRPDEDPLARRAA